MTNEQAVATETMSLDELRAMARQEAAGEVVPPVAAPATKAVDTGREVIGDDLPDEPTNNSTASIAPPALVDAKPARILYRKEIDNEDGSGVDVYEADSMQDLVDKIAAGKANANKKIRELNSRVKQEVAQISADEEYVVGEKFKKAPKQTVREIATEVLRETEARNERSRVAQESFIATHPIYEAVPENASQLTKWVQSHGYSEFTKEALDNAYQELSTSGLLKLKSAQADDAANEDTKETGRTVQPKVEAAPAPSPRRGSGISTRTGTTSTKTNALPNEDEAYDMPLDKLRMLANAQLQKGRE
jgi:hypothetical protein